jgi:hypothetical protein
VLFHERDIGKGAPSISLSGMQPREGNEIGWRDGMAALFHIIIIRYHLSD